MSAHFEVEQKYQPTAAALTTLPDRLADLGFIAASIKQLSDIYYIDAARTFIAQRTTLRLRTCDGILMSLDYRDTAPTAYDARTNARREIELALQNTPTDNAKALLTALGYQEYVTVQKKRTHYASPRFPGINLEWDEVTHLGTYIELEALVDAADAVLAAETRLRDLATQLGMSRDMQADKHYRDLVAAASGVAA